jgi:hypothetical protein
MTEVLGQVSRSDDSDPSVAYGIANQGLARLAQINADRAPETAARTDASSQAVITGEVIDKPTISAEKSAEMKNESPVTIRGGWPGAG